ncbi:hypothetical protein ACQ4PT_018954 [Festuca glaucescens]
MTRGRASSSQPPPADKHAWNIPAAGFSSPIPDWGVDPRPPGGFVNYLHDPSSVLPQQPLNQHTMAQNFHFVGGPLPSAPFPAPQPSVVRGIPSPSLAKERTPLQTSHSQRAINLDSGDEDGDVRTEKRLAWTKDEDERLMSAWLYNSNDPINGNNKKSDQYWGDVARVYNNTTPKSRKRSVKQAKDHWHSLNKLVYQFHCCYSKASVIYASGQSDAQLLEKAYKFYEDDYKSQFHHYDCWKAVNEWPKWRTYNEWLENTKKRKTSDAGEAGEDTSSPKWAVFVKTIALPQTEKHKLFARHQEGARKDVERAFGVLQARFNIVRRPARFWKRASVDKVMEACVILHNMIVEDEGEMINIHLDLNENPGTSFALPPEGRWSGCFSGLSCFGSQKGGKQIVPAARIPDGNASTNRGNGRQSGGNSNQHAAMNPSLLAPPSSPASFSHSALASTAQSPNCFLSISANSPGPTSNMFAVGPYANEPQLVSPPTAFSTYTTEPSTAPLTPPPELAHATTPSSPDVPYARFLSSSMGLKAAGKEQNMHYLSTTYSGGSGFQGSYPLYPGSPSSCFISPASVTPGTGLSSPIPEQDVPTAHWKTSRSACDTLYSIASPIPEQEVRTAQWKTSRSACDTPYSRTSQSNMFGLDSAASRNYLLDTNFFRPAASAQFYLDQAQQSFPYNGGRLSVSRDKQDTDEVEAY